METICKKGQFGIHGNSKEQEVLKEFKKPVMETGPLVNHWRSKADFCRIYNWAGFVILGSIMRPVRIFKIGG
ncbi:hypothetical protein QL285_091765 [Trifolium repens]|nr:hypothetical protein QL285_091765 [Trifolium repens]